MHEKKIGCGINPSDSIRDLFSYGNLSNGDGIDDANAGANFVLVIIYLKLSNKQ